MPRFSVVHLIDSGGLYGAEAMLLELATMQTCQGMDVTVISAGAAQDSDKAFEVAARKHGISVQTWRLNPVETVRQLRDLVARAPKSITSIFHSHGYKFDILLALTPKRSKRVRYVSTIHGYVHRPFPERMWFYENFDRIAIRRLDAVITVNRDLQRTLGNLRWSPPTVSTIPNGIARSLTHKTMPCDRNNQIQDFCKQFDFCFSTIGRLSPEKRVDLAISALHAISAEYSNVGLCILGDGRLRGTLEQQARRLGIRDKVLFAGYVENAAAKMHLFDCIALPSSTEGAPMTILEAMRANVPVVATRVGAIPELLDNGNAGLFIASGDSSSLARVLAELMQSPTLGKMKTLHAYRHFSSHFTSEKMADSYRTLYKTL
jgi:glycosyltransferase involved in cell wall biosynthesis